MNRFLINLLLFCFPLVILLLPPIIVLINSGENFKDLDKIIKSKKKYLVGYAYNEENYKYLKWDEITTQPRKEVLALGSSRVLQFRSDMFSSGFYNAGYTITSINDFVPFLQGIPVAKYPKYLIIGLDQWMFNEKYDDLKTVNLSEFWQNSFKFRPDVGTVKRVIKDLVIRKYGVNVHSQDNNFERIGLNAIVNNTGFRNDGSMYYGEQITKLINNDSTANDYRFSDSFARIKNGNMRFEYGNDVNPEALKKLDHFLEYCKKNNVFVIGFIPPFANEVNDKLASSGKYGYLKGISPNCQAAFKKYNFEFHDLSSLKTVDSSDSEVIDGFHGGELTYLKMLIKMLKDKSVLNSVTSLEKLESKATHPLNRYQVYGY